MKRSIALGLLLLMSTPEAKASESELISKIHTAHELFMWCLATKNPPRTPQHYAAAARCLGFLEGVVKGIKWSEYAAKAIYGEMANIAKKEGDSVLAAGYSSQAKGSEISSEALLACMPLQIPVQQLADTYIAYIETKPNQLAEEWFSVLPAAIAWRYSCENIRK